VNEVSSERDHVDGSKKRRALRALKYLVVVGATAAILVAVVRTLLGGAHTLDVAILEIAAVPLIAVALYSLVRSVPVSGSPVQISASSPDPSTAGLDRALAAPTDPIPPTAISSRSGPDSPAVPAAARPLLGSAQSGLGPVTISGVLSDRSGGSVSGASVTVIEASGREVVRSQSDPTGHFKISALAAGSYSVLFLAPPFRPMIRSVVLAAGLAIVDVTLHGRGTVSARVLGGRRRRPMTGVPVAMARPGGIIERTTATDSTGRYRFDEVDEGEWVVLSGAPRHRDGEQRVLVRAGELVGEDLVLTALGDVTGGIADGGDPIPGVRVTLVDDSGRIIRVARTDRAGTYGFIEVPEGTYAVVALMVEPGTSLAVVGSETDQSLSVANHLLA
jgi:carboxypeptidase family protein/SdrD B-like protein